MDGPRRPSRDFLLGIGLFAVYPFGVRRNMPMARYLYRHWRRGLQPGAGFPV